MTTYLNNAVSCSMISGSDSDRGIFVKEISFEEARKEILQFDIGGGRGCHEYGDPEDLPREEDLTPTRKFGYNLDKKVVSAIGHADTAAVLSDIFDASIEANRVSITLDSDDILIIAQYNGTRLPEGCTSLPEGASFRWFKATPDLGQWKVYDKEREVLEKLIKETNCSAIAEQISHEQISFMGYPDENGRAEILDKMSKEDLFNFAIEMIGRSHK